MKIFVTRKLPDAVEARMASLFDCTFNEEDRPLGKFELIAAMQAHDVLVPTVTDRIDRTVITASSRTKLIASYGAGVDHIDFDAATKQGLTVTNTPDVLTEDTADMVIALILAVARRVVEGENLVRAGEWSGWSPTFMMGTRLRGKRLGIVGMGRIGTAVAQRAKAFGMRLHYHNRRRLAEEIEQELDVQWWDSLDQMLAHMHVISVNCPHTPATYHLLSSRRLKLCRQDAIIVNTARGEVIDEKALVESLRSNGIAGAGLDVFEHEPAISPKLLACTNAVLLPHIGSATLEAREEMGEMVLLNIRTWMDGHQPPNQVIATKF
ncbi:MAG: D-glycerate dehydrogenase [Actinomycetia bacterium]|nr:D-glycerate dehydrogenase [Actinomycetes bacterium]